MLINVPTLNGLICANLSKKNLKSDYISLLISVIGPLSLSIFYPSLSLIFDQGQQSKQVNMAPCDFLPIMLWGS